jgi:hypothetical protein
MRYGFRVLATASVTALLLTASASLAAAAVTIGQLSPGPSTSCADGSDWLQPTVTSGNTYVVPSTGGITAWTVTSWSHNSKAGPGQTLTMKIFRLVAGTTYMVVGHDGPRNLTSGALNTFPASIPVKAGDILGLHSGGGGPDCVSDVPEDTALLFSGDLADGASGAFSPDPGSRLNVTAVVSPTNAFSFGTTTRNKKKGTATLTVNVPNPGELTGSGKGVKAAGAGAVISKTVTAPGAATLVIKAKGKKRKTLNETGKVKLKPKITYTPTGGDPSTRSRKLKLKKL